jgi:Zn-dependent protease
MMQLFGDPGTTQYDLRFSVLGIPVRIHPMFWLIAALLGSNGRPQLTDVAVFIGCMFVSILVHELGHALAARRFGWPPDIVLHGFGGFARFVPGFGYTRGKAIWISFAGPLAGFGLFAIAFAAELLIVRGIVLEQAWARALTTNNAWPAISDTISIMIWINLVWGLFNLLPVFPLDGGQICAEMLNARGSYSGMKRTHQIGMITAVLGAGVFILWGMYLGAMMFGGLAYQNYQICKQFKRGYR